ncbi:PREDICTED: uncharacterized protein LOC104590171 [Nelumbo nucifera]|uniref:Uncharacterized protein LOC104590171 n=2 Tax=Nelumbo nucifera TaxID=4432 RepID=A0A1U7Z7U3_NELNU|nr:PREDICTED: uncharacterized protein LOC104590171 [Nelumbo nucifera]DAD20636.1 TPA_asm: hypothetical protein HUJ06_022099 [Nelumbo nucifera]
MASNLLKLPIQTINTKNPSVPFRFTRTLLPYHSIPLHHRHHHQHQHSNFSFFPPNLLHNSKFPSLSLHCSLSSYAPPTTKEEAILQAKTCLSTTLEKPLNNPRLAGKLKKQKQPRFRVEIPVIDDSLESTAQLAFDVFGDLPMKRKGTLVKILILWSNPTLTKLADEAFQSCPSNHVRVDHWDISSLTDELTDEDTRILNSADVVVFSAPESSQVEFIKTISDNLYPKPVVFFNPKWAFEDESGFGEMSGFLASFEVVYSFMGLEVRGVLSKRKGIVFRYVRDGVLSGERWAVWVEEEGEMKVISRFKKRPSIGEVENVLYNLMAVNSPITKSAKFLRDLVSNVSGKK